MNETGHSSLFQLHQVTLKYSGWSWKWQTF